MLALGFLLIMSGLVFRGIRESMWVNVLCTLIEAAGLLLVISFGLSYWGSVNYFETPPESADAGLPLLVMQGSILTFFAFIGFEDTINVAEEVKNPQRTIPIALVSAMAIAAVLYMAVAITAVSVVPYKELAAAPAPLAEVMKRAAPEFPSFIMTFITLFAVANTALVNYITSSRLIYGMSHQGLLPAKVGEVHPTRQTPHVAIGAAAHGPGASGARRRDQGSRLGHGAAAVDRILHRQRRALHFEAPSGRGEGQLRAAAVGAAAGCGIVRGARAVPGREAAIGKHQPSPARCWRGSWRCTRC